MPLALGLLIQDCGSHRCWWRYVAAPAPAARIGDPIMNTAKIQVAAIIKVGRCSWVRLAVCSMMIGWLVAMAVPVHVR